MDELVRPGSYVALRLPSELIKVVEIQPNTYVLLIVTWLISEETNLLRIISLGRFGTFQANNLIGRPFHVTYEVVDRSSKDGGSKLRPVLAAELHEFGIGETTTPDEGAIGNDGVDFEVVSAEGKVIMRTNQFISDGEASQTLTLEDIEALKKADNSAGKDVIAKILESHTSLDKKTTFSLAKYTLKKSRKYMKRFTVLPMDIPVMVQWLMEGKDAPRIMEMRQETLSLVTSWSNVHWGGAHGNKNCNNLEQTDHNRWLVVDEVSGLLVAAMAEQMGTLRSGSGDSILPSEDISEHAAAIETNGTSGNHEEPAQTKEIDRARMRQAQIHMQELSMSGTTNTITLVHQNAQPNLSLLTYFGYNTSDPDTNHPLYTNLKEISFLQLLRPEEDYAYNEPAESTAEQLKEMKSRQKAAYYRKRRRWQRTKTIVEETRAGDFTGLVVASVMTPASILHTLVPLLRGGAQVVVYSPTAEPLIEVVDYYSKARRSAFASAENPVVPCEEYPVDPRLLIGVSLHTARSRPWQILPGRTHPRMSGRGGSEGYVFVGTKVHPGDGKIEARGSHKKRKLNVSANGIHHGSPDLPSELLHTESPSDIDMEGDKQGVSLIDND